MFMFSGIRFSALKINRVCHCLNVAHRRSVIPICQEAGHGNCLGLRDVKACAFYSTKSIFFLSNRKLNKRNNSKLDDKDWQASVSSRVLSKRNDPLLRLDHKDWLAPTEVLRIFQHLNDADLVLASFRKLCGRKDYKPNMNVYVDVIGKLARARKYEAVEDILNQIKTEKCRVSDEFFYELIKVYGNVVNNTGKAVDTLLRMPTFSCWPTTKTFNFVLNMLVCAKQFDVIHEVYLSASQLGVKVDTCSLNILIKGLCRRRKLDSAFILLKEFPLQGLRPNATTYSTLMHGLCRLYKVDEAFELLGKMEADGCQPDTITFNVLINGLCRAGRVDEAKGLLVEMQRKGCSPNTSSFQAVIYGLLNCKNFVGARELMECMLSKGILPSFPSYKVLITGLCDQKLLNDAEWTLRKMIHHGFIPRLGMWRSMLNHMLSRDQCIGASESLLLNLG